MTDFIGIDIGATNIRVGTIDEDENISFIYKELTFNNVKSSEDLYQKISNLIKLVPNYEMAKAIGIGVPGAIDKSIGKVLSCNKNIEILKNILFVERLNNDFNKPVFIENDARVAALAEALKGRGKNKNIVCFITISTGLGGGLVCNKKIYKEYFLEDVKKRFKEKCHLFAKETIIDIAEFEEPGVLGSALLAKSGYNKQ